MLASATSAADVGGAQVVGLFLAIGGAGLALVLDLLLAAFRLLGRCLSTAHRGRALRGLHVLALVELPTPNTVVLTHRGRVIVHAVQPAANDRVADEAVGGVARQVQVATDVARAAPPEGLLGADL